MTNLNSPKKKPNESPINNIQDAEIAIAALKRYWDETSTEFLEQIDEVKVVERIGQEQTIMYIHAGKAPRLVFIEKAREPDFYKVSVYPSTVSPINIKNARAEALGRYDFYIS